MQKNNNKILTGILALALVFGMALTACGGKKADAQDAGGGAGDAKKAVSGALSALKKGDAAALAAAIKGKTAAELASLFTSDFVSPGGDFSYDLNETEDGIIIKYYTGQNSVLLIPQQIEGFPVLQVGLLDDRDYFNKGKAKISAIIIPEGVKVIGWLSRGAAENLEAVVFPSTLTEITNNSFSWCKKLTSINLSHCVNLTEIGVSGFDSCYNLQSVKLPDSVKIIHDEAFQYCITLTDINIPANIEIIGKNAFNGNKELFNLTIPESITAIRFEQLTTFLSAGDKPINVFEDDKKLPIATRKRLQDLGYKGVF